jgi:disulfide bond formation protein DsbB
VLIERFPSLESASSCDPANPCSLIWVERFGYLTIPTMALSAFALIATLLLLAPKETDG